MKARARERMKKRRAKYLVGYIGAGNTLFTSRPVWARPVDAQQTLDGSKGCADPMTLKQAQALLGQMPCADCAIFELVPVEVNR